MASSQIEEEQTGHTTSAVVSNPPNEIHPPHVKSEQHIVKSPIYPLNDFIITNDMYQTCTFYKGNENPWPRNCQFTVQYYQDGQNQATQYSHDDATGQDIPTNKSSRATVSTRCRPSGSKACSCKDYDAYSEIDNSIMQLLKDCTPCKILAKSAHSMADAFTCCGPDAQKRSFYQQAGRSTFPHNNGVVEKPKKPMEIARCECKETQGRSDVDLEPPTVSPSEDQPKKCTCRRTGVCSCSQTEKEDNFSMFEACQAIQTKPSRSQHSHRVENEPVCQCGNATRSLIGLERVCHCENPQPIAATPPQQQNEAVQAVRQSETPVSVPSSTPTSNPRRSSAKSQSRKSGSMQSPQPRLRQSENQNPSQPQEEPQTKSAVVGSEASPQPPASHATSVAPLAHFQSQPTTCRGPCRKTEGVKQTKEQTRLCLCKQQNAVICIPGSSSSSSAVGKKDDKACSCTSDDKPTPKKKQDDAHKLIGTDHNDRKDYFYGGPECKPCYLHCKSSINPLKEEWKSSIANCITSAGRWRGLRGGNPPTCKCPPGHCKENCKGKAGVAGASTHSAPPKPPLPCGCAAPDCKRKGGSGQASKRVSNIQNPSMGSKRTSNAGTTRSDQVSKRTSVDPSEAMGTIQYTPAEMSKQASHDVEEAPAKVCKCDYDLPCKPKCQEIKEQLHKAQQADEKIIEASVRPSVQFSQHLDVEGTLEPVQLSEQVTEIEEVNEPSTGAPTGSAGGQSQVCECSEPGCMRRKPAGDNKSERSNLPKSDRTSRTSAGDPSIPPASSHASKDPSQGDKVQPCYCPKPFCHPGCHDPDQGEDAKGCLEEQGIVCDEGTCEELSKDPNAQTDQELDAEGQMEEPQEGDAALGAAQDEEEPTHTETSSARSKGSNDPSCVCPEDENGSPEQPQGEESEEAKGVIREGSPQGSQRQSVSGSQKLPEEASQRDPEQASQRASMQASQQVPSPKGSQQGTQAEDEPCVCPEEECENLEGEEAKAVSEKGSQAGSPKSTGSRSSKQPSQRASVTASQGSQKDASVKESKRESVMESIHEAPGEKTPCICPEDECTEEAQGKQMQGDPENNETSSAKESKLTSQGGTSPQGSKLTSEGSPAASERASQKEPSYREPSFTGSQPQEAGGEKTPCICPEDDCTDEEAKAKLANEPGAASEGLGSPQASERASQQAPSLRGSTQKEPSYKEPSQRGSQHIDGGVTPCICPEDDCTEEEAQRKLAEAAGRASTQSSQHGTSPKGSPKEASVRASTASSQPGAGSRRSSHQETASRGSRQPSQSEVPSQKMGSRSSQDPMVPGKGPCTCPKPNCPTAEGVPGQPDGTQSEQPGSVYDQASAGAPSAGGAPGKSCADQTTACEEYSIDPSMRSAVSAPPKELLKEAIAVSVQPNGQPLRIDGTDLPVLGYTTDGIPIVLPTPEILANRAWQGEDETLNEGTIQEPSTRGSVKSGPQSTKEPSARGSVISGRSGPGEPGAETPARKGCLQDSTKSCNIFDQMVAGSIVGSQKAAPPPVDPMSDKVICKCTDIKCIKSTCEMKKRALLAKMAPVMPADPSHATSHGAASQGAASQGATSHGTASQGVGSQGTASHGTGTVPRPDKPPLPGARVIPPNLENLTNDEIKAILKKAPPSKCKCVGTCNELCDRVKQLRAETQSSKRQSRSSVVGSNSNPKDSSTQIEPKAKASCTCSTADCKQHINK